MATADVCGKERDEGKHDSTLTWLKGRHGDKRKENEGGDISKRRLIMATSVYNLTFAGVYHPVSEVRL